jgi:hypothetical protein
MTMRHRWTLGEQAGLLRGALALLVSGLFGVNLRSSGYHCR